MQHRQIEMRHGRAQENRLHLAVVHIIQEFADKRLKPVAVHALMHQVAGPRVPDAHPARPVLAGTCIEVRLADHEVDGQQNVLGDPERRALPTLEDVVHSLAVADNGPPGVAVRVRRIFVVDGGDGVLVRYIDAFDAVGRGEGRGRGSCGPAGLSSGAVP